MIALAGILVANSCAIFGAGSGKVITEARDVSGFSGVVMEGSGELVISQGNEESLVVEAEDNVMPHVITEVKKGTLHLGYRPGLLSRILPSRPVKFNLKMINIAEAGVSGSGSISAAKIETENLKVDISGSGSITVDKLEAEELEARVSGSGSVTIDNLVAEEFVAKLTGSGNLNVSGETTKQDIHISGSGKYHAPELKSQTVTAKITGSGVSVVRVSQSLDVKISGSGKVGYYGNPKLNTSITGSGKVGSLGD